MITRKQLAQFNKSKRKFKKVAKRIIKVKLHDYLADRIISCMTNIVWSPLVQRQVKITSSSGDITIDQYKRKYGVLR